MSWCFVSEDAGPGQQGAIFPPQSPKSALLLEALFPSSLSEINECEIQQKGVADPETCKLAPVRFICAFEVAQHVSQYMVHIKILS